ncbi:MAG: SCO family protein [Fimbriimonadales bacterium]
MSIQSFRILRLFLWGILIVVLLTVGTMYLLRGSILKSRETRPPAIVKTEERTLKPVGEAPLFQLTKHDGSKFDVGTYMGKVFVVDFFFTKCNGICPTLQKNMRKVQQAHAGNDQVRFLSISVDPKNDTPEVLAKMAKDIGADTDTWAWTVGPSELTGEIANGFMLIGSEVPGDILHSNRFVLVDGYGKIRGFYNGTEDGDVEDIIEDIGRLLGE